MSHSLEYSAGKKSRNFAKLVNILCDKTTFYIQSNGEKLEATLNKSHGGFQTSDGKVFSSPTALCEAIAKSGNGWLHIRLSGGPQKDLTIGEVYDIYNE